MTRIKQARLASGMSQKYVAISLGVSAPTVCDWEKGKKNPNHENLQKLADLFCVSIDHLLGRDTNSTEKEIQPAEPVSKLDSELFNKITSLQPHEKQVLITVAEGLIAARSDVRDQKEPQEGTPSQQ